MVRVEEQPEFPQSPQNGDKKEVGKAEGREYHTQSKVKQGDAEKKTEEVVQQTLPTQERTFSRTRRKKPTVSSSSGNDSKQTVMQKSDAIQKIFSETQEMRESVEEQEPETADELSDPQEKLETVENPKEEALEEIPESMSYEQEPVQDQDIEEDFLDLEDFSFDDVVDTVDETSNFIFENEISNIHQSFEENSHEINKEIVIPSQQNISGVEKEIREGRGFDVVDIFESEARSECVVLHPETDQDIEFFLQNPDDYTLVVTSSTGKENWITASDSQSQRVAKIMKYKTEMHYSAGPNGRTFLGKNIADLSRRNITQLSPEEYQKLTDTILSSLAESAKIFQNQETNYREIQEKRFVSTLRKRKFVYLNEMKSAKARKTLEEQEKRLARSRQANLAFHEEQKITENEHAIEREKTQKQSIQMDELDHRTKEFWKNAAIAFWKAYVERKQEQHKSGK